MMMLHSSGTFSISAGIQTPSVDSADKRLEQINRVVSSPVLQGSEALCNLLKFLARQSIAAPDVSIKEYQIATEVFGRPANFDPRVDSAVRVQMSRLRAKLGEYYNTVGRGDRILVEIPKGSHTVIFTDREAARTTELRPAEDASEVPPTVVRPKAAPWKWDSVALMVVALLALAAGLCGVWNKSPALSRAASENAAKPGDPLSQFWQGFLQSSEEPLVVFSRDVVFLGSPSENLSLRELSLGREFRFQTMTQPPRAGDLGIVNRHPLAGEQPVYFGSRDLPITEDYAVVEMITGSAPAQSILTLAGTTTFGTQGAVEFLCDEERVRQLLPHVQAGAGHLAPFTALLHVKVQRGVPVDTTLAALRRLTPP